MSDRESIKQSVSVFHFTLRLSSAKSRQYRLATEKGMGPPGSAPQATPSIPPTGSTARSNSTASMEPPAKKPRLRLSVRKQSNDGDTIAVSRPKRASAGRSRYSEEAVLSDDEVEEVKGKPSPAASSVLSSLDSASVMDEATEGNAKRGGQRESYGDFMSYYIMDGDDAEEASSTKPSKPPPTKEKPAISEKQRGKVKANQAAAPVTFTPPTLPDITYTVSRPGVSAEKMASDMVKRLAKEKKLAKEKRKRSKMLPPQQVTGSVPASQQKPAQRQTSIPFAPRQQGRPQPATRPTYTPATRPAPPPDPPVMEEIKVKYHASVPDKVKKLQALSSALTNFGGVPPTAKSPVPHKKEKTKASKPEKDGKAPVDDFLAMFDDDDSDSKDEAGSETPVEEPRYLEHTGEPDGPLTYGIQFIMNALKSWAQQRLHQQQLAAMHPGQMPPPSIPGNQNPERPGSSGPSSAKPTPLNQLNLSDTPEGQAIAAFRDVVESGCLQVNVVMPADLASAVRHLYVQIDHLINQGSKSQPEQFQCMSYSAQIEAHEYRVKRWNHQQMLAQEEMARQQQHYAQHQMMQLGGQPVFNERSPYQQFNQQGHHPVERRRSTPHGQSSNRHPPRVSLPANAAGMQPMGTPPSTRIGHGPPDGRFGPQHGPNGAHADNVSLLMANLLPRSGQTMKFSFAPSNEAAIQAFGAGAFPAMSQNQAPSLPNRGPMSASPGVSDPSAAAVASEQHRFKSEEDDSRPGLSRRETNSAEAHAHPTPAPAFKSTSGFTAVNAPKISNANRRSFSAGERRASKASQPDAVVLDD